MQVPSVSSFDSRLLSLRVAGRRSKPENDSGLILIPPRHQRFAQGFMTMADSFGSRASLRVGDSEYTIHRLPAIEKHEPAAARLPYSLKILLENLLRTEDGRSVRAEDIQALASWQPQAEPQREIAF